MKKFILLCVTVSLIFALTACGNSKEKDAEQQGDEKVYEFTGILEEKKDFMIIVNSEDGKNSYVFNLEGVACDAENGDKVKVSYTGDIEDFDARLMAVEIKKVE